MLDIIALSRQAWAFSKTELQPNYDDLIQSYRDMLTARAERVVQDRTAPNTDDIFARFERNVLELVVPERFHQPNPVLPVKVKEELVEEVKDEHLKGHLPADFPAYDKLHEAGINTYGQLAKMDDITEVEGIGPATAKAIVKRVKAEMKKLNG